MVSQSKAQTAHAKDQGSVLSTMRWLAITCNCSSRGSEALFLPPCALHSHAHTPFFTYTQLKKESKCKKQAKEGLGLQRGGRVPAQHV